MMKSPNKGSLSLPMLYSAEEAVSIILKYIDDYLFAPALSWDKNEFRVRSYQRWAAFEIVDRLADKPFDICICTISEFAMEMLEFAYYGEDEQTSMIFKIAAETAETLYDILCFVQTKGEENNASN